MEELLSNRGGKIVKHNGYLFYKNSSRNDIDYYRCEEKVCRATLIMKNGKITNRSKRTEHTHPPNPREEFRRKFSNEMKRRCLARPSEPASRIYREIVDEMANGEEAALCLPGVKTATNIIYRVRASVKAHLPKTLQYPVGQDGRNSLLVEDQKTSENSCSSEQNTGDANLVESDEVIVRCTGSSEMETQNSAPTNLMSNSDVVFKQEIIETEEESNEFDNSSLHSSFVDSNTETQSDRQTPNASYLDHSESSNFNANSVRVEQTHDIAMAQTIPVSLSIEKIESDVFANSCDATSGIDDWSDLSVVDSGKLLKAESTLAEISNNVTTSFPPLVNVSVSNSLSSTAPVKPGASSATAPVPFPQVVNTTSLGNSQSNSFPCIPQNLNQSFIPRDQFDAYGMFIASKLRILDAKSCNFVQAAFADLIFKAESGMFSNRDEERVISAFKSAHTQSESDINEPEKENVQPVTPCYGPHVAPNFNLACSSNLPRSEPIRPRDPPLITNPPFPTFHNNTVPTSSMRNGSNQPRIMSHTGIPWPQPVINVAVPEDSTLNSSPQIRLSSSIDPHPLPQVLNQANSFNNIPFQSRYQDHVKPRDEFDAFGEFAASKLRTLDKRSCAFVQTTFVDLVFEAELGRFLSEGERSIFANRTNEILRNMPPASNSPLHSLRNVVSILSGHETQSQMNFGPTVSYTSQVPLEAISNLHCAPK